MSPELIAVCKKLVKDGKTISVGMIKSRAPKNTPLPHIIQAVQFCKNQTAALLEMETPEELVSARPIPDSEAEALTKLHVKITELEARVAKLESKLNETQP